MNNVVSKNLAFVRGGFLVEGGEMYNRRVLLPPTRHKRWEK